MPNAHCGNNTVDEGTPDIIKKSYGYFYVTFHGYDYGNNIAVRGISKTRDFKTWYMFGYDLPGDTIYSPWDCNGQNGHNIWTNIKFNSSTGCVGGGEGTIIYDGNYYYHIIETMDQSLVCYTQLGYQNWVHALLRSPSLNAKSGTWQQLHSSNNSSKYVNEPVVVPWKKYGCGLQYHRLFKDDIKHNVYFATWINDFSNGWNQLNIYKLAQMTQNNGIVPIVVAPFNETSANNHR